ncbi:MAG TPA: hypothetical protein VFV65_07130 [Gemmatimonadales bacterium]|nr:hypothetical protein [Gemmatimonadales bacterium]
MMRIAMSCLVLLAALPPGAGAQAPSHQGRAIAPAAAVRIFNLAGTVRVTGWNRDSIDVTAVVPEGAGRLVFGGGSGGVKLGIDPPVGVVNYPGSLVEVKVSSLARVWIKTESAEILVSGLTSSVDVSSVSGRIVITGEVAQVSAESMDGGIDVEVTAALVRLKSAGGAIVLRGQATDATLSTVSGAATAVVRGLERGRMETVGGNLTFDTELRAGGNYTLESHSGDINIRLPAAVNGAVDLSALEGRVVNRLTKNPVRSANRGRGESAAFSAGTADADLVARTFKGTITIELQTN